MIPGAASSSLRAGLLAAAVLLLLTRLGGIDLWAPDEPRYAQVAEELRSFEQGARGLVLLHLNGEPYTQKPPLYFWLAAGVGALGGRVDEVAARLPSALAGLGLVGVTLAFGSRLLGGSAGLLGAALLLTTFEFAHLARRAQLDVLLALFETLALAAFWRLDRGLGRAAPNLLGMHAALGLAVLTKGPVGFVVPLLVMATYLILEGRARELRRVLPPWGLLVSLGPALAWIATAVWLAPPGYFGEAVGTNLFGRFFAGTSHARPVYYYLYQLPVDFLPWTFLWPAMYWAGRHRVLPRRGVPRPADEAHQRSWRFLLAWVGASLLFFTLSSGKRGLYLLPAFPALALLCADAVGLAVAGRARLPRAFDVGAACLAVLLLALGGVAVFPPSELRKAMDEPYLRAFGMVTILVVVAAAGAWWILARNRTPHLARLSVAIAAALGVEVAAFLLLYRAIEPGKSPRPVAQAAAELTREGGRIGLLSDRAMTGGLAYYGDRRVALLDSPASIDAFVRAGGSAIVVKRRKKQLVEQVVPVSVHSSFRTGRRTVLVVSPRPVDAPSPAPPAGHRDARTP